MVLIQLMPLYWLTYLKILCHHHRSFSDILQVRQNKLQRYNINRPRPRHRDNYAKIKMCFSIMMVSI